MKITAICLIGAAMAAQGCTTTYQPSYVPNPAYGNAVATDQGSVEDASAEDVAPPVPSFMTLDDCERAYGPQACGSGQVVYQSAGIEAPSGADAWFIPYAFGVMTGVLVNQYFAPPGIFLQNVEYRSFTSTTVVNSYKVINKTTINNYYHAPLRVRTEAARSGPVRYSAARGVITSHVARTVSAAPRVGAASTSTQSRYVAQTARGSGVAQTAPTHTSTTSPSRSSAPAPTYQAQNSRATSNNATSSYQAPARSSAPAYSPPRSSAPAYTPPRASSSSSSTSSSRKTCQPSNKNC